MSSRHLVDPETADLLDQFAPLELTHELVLQLRAQAAEAKDQLAAQFPIPPDVEAIECFVPGPPGAPDVRLLIYLPRHARRPLPALLSIHGGGYILGSADDLFPASLAAELGCAAVSVEYRLAPETPYPGAVEDCYAALLWLQGQAAELGIDRARIAIGGGSAGGGLAASLALLARDRGVVKPAFQMLIYPMLDDRTGTTSDPHPYTGEFGWTAENNRFGWRALLGEEPGGPDVSPYAAAARAESLEGLPPTFISVGALDLFLEEDMEYARRLMRAGVPVELHVYPGAIHGFDVAAESQVAQAHRRDLVAALRRGLGADSLIRT